MDGRREGKVWMRGGRSGVSEGGKGVDEGRKVWWRRGGQKKVAYSGHNADLPYQMILRISNVQCRATLGNALGRVELSFVAPPISPPYHTSSIDMTNGTC